MTTPQAGKSLTETIMSGFKSPPLKVKYSNNTKAFYYPNSPTIPRYSLTCTVDPREQKEFIKTIKTIETNEKCASSPLKVDTVKSEGEHIQTGLVMLKFSDKKPVPIFTDEHCSSQFEGELPVGTDVIVKFDITRYTQKDTGACGLTLKPVLVYVHNTTTEQQPV